MREMKLARAMGASHGFAHPVSLHQSYYDPLTRLPNRKLVYDLLDRAIKRAERNRHFTALLLVDVNDLRIVNDTIGHYEGDLVLCRLAAKLKSCLRNIDAAGRYGGDEFVVILEDLHNRDDVTRVLRNLMTSLKEPVSTAHGELKLDCSIGVALCPFNGHDAATLIRKADLAMYQAKTKGRSNYRFAEPTI